MRRFALAALLFAAACATPPPDRVEVRKLAFHGNHALEDSELRAHLLTGSPSWQPWKRRPELDEATLAEDLVRIRKLYQRHGYFDARAEVALRWSDSRDSAAIEIRIEEGPPVTWAQLAIDLEPLPGGSAQWRGELLDALPVREGEVFSLDHYEAAKRLLRDRLSDRGFPRPRLLGGAEVDAANRTAAIRWTVEPGPRVQLGETRVSGLDRVDEYLVLREIVHAQGEPYSRSALRESERRIYDLGLFQSVGVRSVPSGDTGGAESIWPVEVEVVERPLRSLRVGLGYGSEDSVRGLIGWQRRNFLGGARLLELSLRHSSLLQGAEVSLVEPRVFGGEVALHNSARLEREYAASFDAERALARVSLTRPLRDPWSGSLSYSLERNDVTDVSRAAELALDDPREIVRLGYLEAGLERRNLSGGVVPSSGSSLALGAQFSSGFLGSQHNYLKATADWRAYFGVYGSVLALRLHAGAIQPLAGTQADELPLVVRFFSGGSQSVRGFDYQELGPLDASGEPLGGASLAEASAELRVPLWRGLGGVVFLDAGQVDLEPFRWKPDQIFYSAGTGLRYDTPVGPLRIDFGWVLNPPPEIDRFRVHLAVGHAF